MKIAVKDIHPNPFRHLERYPIRRDKVAALRESIQTTGFWDNLVARKVNGKAEIAYGHHRLVVLKEEFDPNHEVNLIIRKLDDETMIQIMARENMEEWGTSVAIEHETIRTVVEAYAEGKIELPAPPPNLPAAQIRYAPSFIPGGRRGTRGALYTAQSIAEFIGWLEPSGKANRKVEDGVTALQLIEEEILREADFDGLGTYQAHAVVKEARKARKRRETLADVEMQKAEAAEQVAKVAEEQREKAQRPAEAKKAKQKRDRALAHARQAKAKAASIQKKSIKAARRVGRTVSKSIRSGKVGYKEASTVAFKIEGENIERSPVMIEEYAEHVLTNLNKAFDPERHKLAEDLYLMVKYRDSLGRFLCRRFVRLLDVVDNRVKALREEFKIDETQEWQNATVTKRKKDRSSHQRSLSNGR